VPAQSSGSGSNYASGTPSPAARKILDEKNIAPAAVTGTGKWQNY
jgi:2-oxoglutarate dehydrogenase E2 component (dihydrolipoamide succinyltransferase)